MSVKNVKKFSLVDRLMLTILLLWLGLMAYAAGMGILELCSAVLKILGFSA